MSEANPTESGVAANPTRPGERRRPRESFTRSLVGICERLDAKSESTIEYYLPILKARRIGGVMTVKARRLWVAGSYARGALTCGDLDLLIELEGDRLAPAHRVGKALFGTRPGVRLYGGTLKENESGVAFPEAVLIWADDGSDWRSRIDAIRPDPNAGRFSRENDIIPFRPEQLYVTDGLDDILAQHAAGSIRWSFHPIDREGTGVGIARTQRPADAYETEDWDFAVNNLGRKSRELYEFLISFLDQSEDMELTELETGSRDPWRFGDAVILVGRPAVPLWELDSPDCARLMICPHLSVRGPNGIWVIERGDAHPLLVHTRQALERQPVYYVTTEGESPEVAAGGTGARRCARVVDLFTSVDEAEKEVEFWKDQDPELQPVIRTIDARRLLSEIAAADVIHVNGEPVALSWLGSRCMNDGTIVNRTARTEVLKALGVALSATGAGSPPG